MDSFSILYEQLDKLKAGILPSDEKAALLQKYQTDADFRKEVHFYLAAQQAIIADFEREMAQVNRAEMHRWYQEAQAQNAVRRKWIYGGIAATLLLFIVGVWHFLSPKTPCVDNITQEYAVTLSLSTTTMGVNAPKPAETVELKNFEEAYQQGKYEEAIKFANNLAQLPDYQQKATLYLALCELQLHHADKALDYLANYEKNVQAQEKNASALSWWRLMAYYQKGETTKAAELAKEIIAQKRKYHKEAAELLPCLER